ncbi:MAG: hypothetical protein AAGI17_07380 [Planctomycetota bacterium]
MNRSVAAAAVLSCVSAAAFAQSTAPSLFDTILNIGDDPSAGVVFDATNVGGGTGNVSLSNLTGNVLGQRSQLNVYSGGTVAQNFTVGLSSTQQGTVSATVLNLFGGTLGRRVSVENGAVLNVMGGFVTRSPINEAINVRGGLLNVSGGEIDGDVDVFANSTVNITGGDLGTVDVRANTAVTVSGGLVNQLFTRGSADVLVDGGSVRSLDIGSSEVTVTDGAHGGGFVFDGAVVNVTGGTFDRSFDVERGTLNISGGILDGSRLLTAGSGVINLSGGMIGSRLDIRDGTKLNIFGTEFFLDGVEITGLEFNEAFRIDDRSVSEPLILSGLLADGSAFAFDLGTDNSGDEFESGATLTITRVPAPGAALAFAASGLFAARRRR